MSEHAAVLVVGAGASGVLAAAHLRQQLPRANIVLVSEGNPGRGLAFGRAAPEHLLNVPAAFMSAFANEPDDFVRFAAARVPGADGAAFLPRDMFGAYLTGVLAAAETTIVAARVTELHTDGPCVRTLADGRTLTADAAILATGNPAPVVPNVLAPLEKPCLAADPWDAARFDGLAPDGVVLLIGTGLTMVDQVMSLRARGHRGPVTAVSRRGQIPRAHLAGAAAHWAIPDTLPISTRALMQTLRDASDEAPWRCVVDGLRPHTTALWQAMPHGERARFLRHARAYWDVRRSRIAPPVATVLDEATASGQFGVFAGRVVSAKPDGVRGTITMRGRSGERVLSADKVVVCTGPGRHTGAGILRMLADAGTVRDDALGLGVDATPEGNVIGRDGAVSTRLFALGPPMRGVLWESIAIPDIARQAAALAAHVVAGLRARGMG